MRPIKFRFKDAFGVPFEIELKVEGGWVVESTIGARISGVDPNSVVQLVGYDELGNEIYEGDEFADPFNGRVFTAKVGVRVQEKDDDTPLQDFIDGFYVLKPIKIDVLFSVPDLSDKDFQKMFDELIEVRSWFKTCKNKHSFEIFAAGRNITISGRVSKKSLGYLQQVLDEYGIEEIVNREVSENKHLTKLTDLAGRGN